MMRKKRGRIKAVDTIKLYISVIILKSLMSGIASEGCLL
jgi:hypothetical protein